MEKDIIAKWHRLRKEFPTETSMVLMRRFDEAPQSEIAWVLLKAGIFCEKPTGPQCVVAFGAWLATEGGHSTLDHLPSGSDQPRYLRNRVERAFMAGTEVAQ